MNETQQFSPKETAQALGVSEATIKRWVDKGKILAEKTLGGHRKISLKQIKIFCEESKYSIKYPEFLGITVSTGRQKDKIRISKEELNQAFKECDELKIKGLLTSLSLANVAYEDIFDQVLSPALQQLGCDWQDGSIDAFQERRCIQICTRLLYSFEHLLNQAEPDAPIALLGSLKDDPYIIPLLMLEIILRSNGWRTEFLGNDLESASYQKAIELYQADMLVISCSGQREEKDLVTDLSELQQFCDQNKCQFIVGGSQITETVIESLTRTSFLNSMTGFKNFLVKS